MPEESLVAELGDGDLEGEIAGVDGLLIVEFWDPWCGICAEMAPVYAKLAEKFRGKAVFAKLNMRDNRASPDRFEVYVTPTFILFREGKEIKRLGGLIEPEALEEEFRKSF